MDYEKKWWFEFILEVGEMVSVGDVIGIVEEIKVIKYKIMVLNGIKGMIKIIEKGLFIIDEIVCVVEIENGDKNLMMF